MVYLKSFLAGLAALIFAGVLSVVAIAVYLSAVYKPTEDEAIGWDPVSLAHRSPWLTALPVLVFAAGFIWELRRARSR
jgi:hypothetical protein